MPELCFFPSETSIRIAGDGQLDAPAWLSEAERRLFRHLAAQLAEVTVAADSFALARFVSLKPRWSG